MSITTSAQQILQQSGASPDLEDTYWELVESYRGELINQAHAILGRLADAEDVVQETFCEAVRHPEKLKEADSLTAWLRSINRANALNRLRGRSRHERKSERKRTDGEGRAYTTGGFSVMETQETIARMIEDFPSRERTVLNLRYWQHLSHAEIAKKIDLPIGTVGRILYQASQQIYGELRPFMKKNSVRSRKARG